MQTRTIVTLWLPTSGKSGVGGLAIIADTLQQTYGLLAWLQIWIPSGNALLQSCLCNSSWSWRRASNQSILKCPKQYPPLWWSLPLKIKATQRFWLSESGTDLAFLLHIPWALRGYFVVLRCAGCHSPTLSTLVRLHLSGSSHHHFQFTTF